MNATMSPETAVTGLSYWNHEVGTSSQLIWADWVNRSTAALAGASRNGVWGTRIESINQWLGLSDLDAIADATAGERIESTDFTGRGGKLTLAGVLAAVELVAERAKAAESRVGPSGPETYECLECGAVYPAEQRHLIDASGMGCRRCN
jgi:hypothetical protein